MQLRLLQDSFLVLLSLLLLLLLSLVVVVVVVLLLVIIVLFTAGDLFPYSFYFLLSVILFRPTASLDNISVTTTCHRQSLL